MRVADGTYITYVAEDGRGTADFHQTINLSRIVNPWTLSGKPTVLTKSEYDWEMHGYGQSSSDPNLWYPKVVEGGTAVYGANGEVYLAYAASGYWTIYYSIGFLRYRGGDPFDAANWVKNPEPILSRSSTVNGIGTGPTFTDHDGNAWICYQARIGTTTASGRFAFVEPYHAGATALSIGEGTGHPASLQKTYTVNVNPVPLRAKIGGFDRTT
jgi:GH43 family beta-xylosidase